MISYVIHADRQTLKIPEVIPPATLRISDVLAHIFSVQVTPGQNKIIGRDLRWIVGILFLTYSWQLLIE